MSDPDILLSQKTSLMLLIRSISRGNPHVNLNIRMIGPVNISMNGDGQEIMMHKAFDMCLDSQDEELRKETKLLPYKSTARPKHGPPFKTPPKPRTKPLARPRGKTREYLKAKKKAHSK